jgi:hypothetical protein
VPAGRLGPVPTTKEPNASKFHISPRKFVTTFDEAPLIKQAVPSEEVPVAVVVKVITLPAAPEAELKVIVREAACASGSIAGIVILGIAIFGMVIWVKGGLGISGIFI